MTFKKQVPITTFSGFNFGLYFGIGIKAIIGTNKHQFIQLI
jgi:hypothetical protein